MLVAWTAGLIVIGFQWSRHTDHVTGSAVSDVSIPGATEAENGGGGRDLKTRKLLMSVLYWWSLSYNFVN